MSALKQAFEQAGYENPEQKALRLATEAWGRFPSDVAGGARIRYVHDALRGETGWEVVTRYRRDAAIDAVTELLAFTRAKIEASRPTSSAKITLPELANNDQILDRVYRGRLLGDYRGNDLRLDVEAERQHRSRMYPTGGHYTAVRERDVSLTWHLAVLLLESTPDEQTVRSFWRQRAELNDLFCRARTELDAKVGQMKQIQKKVGDAENLSIRAYESSPQRLLTNGLHARAERVHEEDVARLNSFLIDGRSLGECTAREALAWCDRQEISVEFVRSLCFGVPLDDQLNRWYGRHPEEVEELWKRVNSQEARERYAEAKRQAQQRWAALREEAGLLGAEFEGEVERADIWGDLPTRQVKLPRRAPTRAPGDPNAP